MNVFEISNKVSSVICVCLKSRSGVTVLRRGSLKFVLSNPHICRKGIKDLKNLSEFLTLNIAMDKAIKSGIPFTVVDFLLLLARQETNIILL